MAEALKSIGSTGSMPGVQGAVAEALKSIGSTGSMPGVQGAVADFVTARGAMNANWALVSALKAHESAFLVNMKVPAPEWLETASLLSAQIGVGVPIRDLGNISNRIAVEATKLVGMTLAPGALQQCIEDGLSAWDTLVGGMSQLPSPRKLERLTLGGSSALSILGSGVLLSDASDYNCPSSDVCVVLDNQQFRSCLAELGPAVVARWEGAWERVRRPGPDAASQAAHSLVELIDLSLRKGAPDTPVLAWHKTEGRPDSELNKGKPTRSLRLHYLVRERQSDLEAAEIFISSLLGLVRLLQKKKHCEGDSERLAVQRLIPGIETMLYFVFGYE